MKQVITEKENEELYLSLNSVINFFAELRPEKYTSLESICYYDLTEDVLIPFLSDLEPEIIKTDEQLKQAAHSIWVELIKNGDIDEFCRKV
jgi:hypothetical protein